MFDAQSVSDFLSAALHIGLAYLIAVPVGWEREGSVRSLGLRTFPLVSMASAGFVLLCLEVFEGSPESQARVIQGLMTGIGFIGGGAILKGKRTVRGSATAASIWATGAMGAAAAYGRFDIAILLSAVTFITLHWLNPVKKRIEKEAGLSDDE
jgi:putative Mg2+ transporter-C (MgtC) family protein